MLGSSQQPSCSIVQRAANTTFIDTNAIRYRIVNGKMENFIKNLRIFRSLQRAPQFLTFLLVSSIFCRSRRLVLGRCVSFFTREKMTLRPSISTHRLFSAGFSTSLCSLVNSAALFRKDPIRSRLDRSFIASTTDDLRLDMMVSMMR